MTGSRSDGFLRSLVRSLLPLRLRRSLSRSVVRLTRWPPVGTVRLGDLRRLRPVSSDWGFDRGLPIDRYYIERFLSRHAQDIRGDVMEVDADTYTRKFGGKRVAKRDVLALHPEVAGATLVGDLAVGEELPSDAFDCVIVTQTLQFIYDVRGATGTLHRLLRPGGVALVTVSGTISKLDRDPDGRWASQWGFTEASVLRLFREAFADGEVEVTSYGNVLAGVAFLHGLAARELREEELDHEDPDFPVVVAARARKAG